jgi:hypothetical protein
MRNCRVALLRFRFASLLFFYVIFLSSSVLAQAVPAETAPPVALDFTADYIFTIIFGDKEKSVTHGKIYVSPPRIRVEPHPEKGGSGYSEYLLYEFKERKMQRIFPKERIYFETDITERNWLKAMRDGWIPWEDFPKIERRKIKLKEDMANGHPCILYLQERKAEIPRGKEAPLIQKEYILRWEATDLKNLPVRVVYFLQPGNTVIVDYNNVKVEEFILSFFAPPEGFLNLSPF